LPVEDVGKVERERERQIEAGRKGRSEKASFISASTKKGTGTVKGGVYYEQQQTPVGYYLSTM
jgi:hypothetical protein